MYGTTLKDLIKAFDEEEKWLKYYGISPSLLPSNELLHSHREFFQNISEKKSNLKAIC